MKAILTLLKVLSLVKEVKKTVGNDDNDAAPVDELDLSGFYGKHKAKIWSVVWIVAMYFGGDYVKEAVNSLPVVTDIVTRLDSVEQKVELIKSCECNNGNTNVTDDEGFGGVER